MYGTRWATMEHSGKFHIIIINSSFQCNWPEIKCMKHIYLYMYCYKYLKLRELTKGETFFLRKRYAIVFQLWQRKNGLWSWFKVFVETLIHSATLKWKKEQLKWKSLWKKWFFQFHNNEIAVNFILIYRIFRGEIWPIQTYFQVTKCILSEHWTPNKRHSSWQNLWF